MSTTKRYLESLPKEQQDDILGLPPDEWADDAENESTDWLDEPGDEQCADIFQQVERARLVKPRGKCVQEVAYNGVVWDV